MKHSEVEKFGLIIQYDFFRLILLTVIIAVGVTFCYWMYTINRFKEILVGLTCVLALIGYLATVKLRVQEEGK